ncbi:MAG: hypothetical protein J5I65_18685 [Aridibacter famidurans]|nr:hypothetical protein [Aridibacter famidurans]
MTSEKGKGPGAKFGFTSSVRDDVWLPGKGPEGYEWWYFDALSDSERESVVVIFLDNFIFSPRYNSLNRKSGKNGSGGSESSFPAVAFFFYRDGKPLYRCINEYPADHFSADPEWPHCEIGGSSFRFEETPYGQRYMVDVKAPMRRGKTLRARFEWLSVETDLLPGSDIEGAGHFWNLVSSRSDVTGKIEILDGGGRCTEEVDFRGTGYHDHNRDSRWLPDAVSEWTWGRVHFTDSTAVLYDYHGTDPSESVSSLFVATESGLACKPAEFEIRGTRRDIFGLKYPSRIRITTEDGLKLTVKDASVIDSSFFYTRFLFEATLSAGDGVARRSCGIGEFLAPGKLKTSLFDPLINMRIGRDGKPAFLS